MLLLLASGPLARRSVAQENRGSIRGTVTDNMSAPMPGATVRSRNLATGVTTTTQSDESGNFNLPFLPPGNYRVDVAAKGFANAVNPSITVHAGDTAQASFALQVGSVNQEVTVSSAAPLLNTENTTTEQTLSSITVQSLPLSGENLLAEALLGPGMEQSQNGISAILQQTLTGGVTVTANGMRDSANELTIDGANMNIGMYNYPSYTPMPDAVQEFSVVTGNYSAEYGQFAGAHLNYNLKSGTNRLHGNAWEYLENNDLNARNFFAASVPTLRQNYFGGEVDGPIWRNKTFFMVAYAGLRNFTNSLLAQTVVTQAQRNGDLSHNVDGSVTAPFNDPLTGLPFTNNQIPTGRISTAAKAALALDPMPTQTGAVNYTAFLGTPRNDDEGMVKLDHSFSQNDQLSGRYVIRDLAIDKLSDTAGQEDLIVAPIQTKNLALMETHVLTPNSVLATRVSINRQHNKNLYPQVPPGTDVNQLFGINNPYYPGSSSLMNIYPEFIVTSFTSIGLDGDAPLIQPDSNYEIAADLAVTHGKHVIKAGFELDRNRSERQVNDNTNGVLSFSPTNPAGSGNALADFLLGYPNEAQVATMPVVIDLRRTATGVYVDDTWTASPKLTVEMGLRYEMDAPANEHNGRASLFNFTAPGGFEQLAPGQALWHSDLRDFAPRLGLTYALTKKDVLRTFGGIFYSNPPTLALTNLASNPPFITSYSFFAAAGTPLLVANPYPAGSAAAGGVPAPITVQQYRRTPAVYEWMLDVQHSFTPSLLADVAYVANRGTHLGRTMGLNVPLTGGPGSIQSRRPLPNFGPVTSFQYDSISTYESLQAKLDKHFSHGFEVLASYTWSKSLDRSSNENSGGTVIPTNLNFDYGPSDFDIPNNLTVSYIYDLPFGHGQTFLSQGGWLDEVVGGWQLSGITTLHGGYPNTITWPGDVANVGLGTRPIRTCSGKLANRTYHDWYDVSCFKAPAQYTFGNSERGIIRGPGYKDWDMALMKSFRTYHEQSLQFRFEFFNIFNNVNFGQPKDQVNVPGAGQITSASAARLGQVALEYKF